MPKVLITSGEPAGIGPELCAMIAARHRDDPYPARLVMLGDRALLEARAERIGARAAYADYGGDECGDPPDAVEIWNQPLATAVRPGTPDPANGASVIAMLVAACDACARGDFDAMVTAPVQKSTLNDAGFPFTGHTEFLAERTGTRRVVMLLVGGAGERPLRVALATTHLPLADVPRALTREVLDETLDILARDLEHRFGIAAPRIAVCGLNPHAGEGGHLGREEIEVITPAVKAARQRGLQVEGPYPADTIFVPMHARAHDAILAMFHDQGLPTLKAVSFGGGVNVTLGLPFVRTSVDHGTALDLAAHDDRARNAEAGSLHAALELAIALAPRHAPGR